MMFIIKWMGEHQQHKLVQQDNLVTNRRNSVRKDAQMCLRDAKTADREER